ncbi:biopolymer transporter ExbD [candidate division KSB1 bacterium]|nr:biopolymer transporter ExbD [candidate division KSB1 bacterium]
MTLKILAADKRKPQLHSLIDMSFILLLFFLVTSMIVQMKEKELKLSIPTPKNEPGRAQIFVQLIDEHRFLYIDQSANSIVEQVNTNFGFQSQSWRNERIISRFIQERASDKNGILTKLAALKDQALKNPEARFFILIRCPDEIPYYHIIDLVQAVAGASNIQYGCVGGSLADLQNATSIRIAIVTDRYGIRSENLVINF